MPWPASGDSASPYRRIWMIGTVTLTAVGVLAAIVFVQPTTSLVLFLLGFAIAVTVHVSHRLTQEESPAQALRAIVRGSAAAGVAVVAMCGYIVTAGVAAVFLLGLVVATSPPVLHHITGRPAVRKQQTPPDDVDLPPLPPPVRHHRRDRNPAPTPPPPPPPAAPSVDKLSHEELCLAWRRSFTSLQKARTTRERLAVVNARLAYLDELERRQPDAFSRWLESNPRAAGDPSRFFHPDTNNHEST